MTQASLNSPPSYLDFPNAEVIRKCHAKQLNLSDYFCIAGLKPRAVYMPGMFSTTELHPHPSLKKQTKLEVPQCAVKAEDTN